MTKPKINESDLCRAARRAGTSTAEIETFLAVETKGNGFDSQGRPVILFERHWFHKLTRGKYSKEHPDISNPRSGGYGKSSEQYARFSKAFNLDPEAAMKSASWGRGQVMGFNHKIVGYDTVGAFVDAMKESEGKQLDAAIEYIIFNGLDDELRRHDWRGFAKGYNGPAYEKNDYHTKLREAYAKFSKRKISCKQDSAATATVDQREESETSQNPHATDLRETAADNKASEIQATSESADGTQTVSVTAKNEQDVNQVVKTPEPEPYRGVGFWKSIKNDLLAATGGNLSFAALQEYVQQASGWPEWVIAWVGKLAVGALIATVVYFIFRVVHYCVDRLQQSARTRLLAEINSDKNRKDIELVPRDQL